MAALVLSLCVSASGWAADCTSAVRDVEVVTLNAWGLPYPIAPARRSRMSRIADFLDEQSFDVVGLQEVWRGAVGMLVLDGLVLPRASGDSGLAVWSRHPVDAAESRTFRAARGFDRYKNKGLLMSEVELPDFGTVNVWVTHMQAGPGPRNAEVRALQVDEILDEARGADGPVVLMGDFNLYEGEAVDERTKRRLADAGLLDPVDTAGGGGPTHRDGQRYDRMFLRDGGRRCLAAREVEVMGYDDDPATRNPVFLSDHLPVRATLSLAVDPL